MDSLSKSGEFFLLFSLFSKNYGEFFEIKQKILCTGNTGLFFCWSPVGEILHKKKH
jgi:hypothetical protein